MTLPAHFASGYLVSKIYCNNLNLACSNDSAFTTFTIIGSLLPDIDGLFSGVFGGYLKDHRNTPFHTPFFWLCISSIIYSFGFLTKNYLIQNYIIALSFGVFLHFFLDWYGGRAAGIRIFYPFSKTIYSFFPINPEKGKIPVIPKNKKDIKKYVEFIKFYFENKILLFSEILIILSGFILLISDVFKH